MKRRKKKKARAEIPVSTPMTLPPKASRDFLDSKCRKVVWSMPVYTKNEILERWMWRSLCNRYWIARVSPSYGYKPYYTWGHTDLVELHGGGARYADRFGDVRTQDYRHTEYRELYRCLEKIRQDFEDRTQMTCELDDSVFMEIAQRKKLDELPPIVETKSFCVEERKVTLDKFGFVEGTDKAKFNAALTRKWRSFIRLKRRAGVKSRMRRHLLKLIKLGIVVESDNCFRLHKKYG